ncbi:MAG: ABC transporter substrate-binding protein, partial [Pontimonas sp.]
MSVISKAGSGLAIFAASALVLSGCAAGSAEPAAEEAAEETTESAPVGDLTLKIGTALPQTGNLAFLGPPEEAGVALAVADINAAGAGITVEVEWGDSGDTDNKAYETEIPRLLNAGVKAILGAASSGTSLQFIDQVVAADVIQFSPANTSAAFTTYEDNGLYWRTAPSDVLQGEVLGNWIAEDGHQNIAMIVLNDSYGTGLAQFTTEAFEAAGG